MLVRKYRARNLREALAQIKEELGDGATILSTRTVSAGLFRSDLEVTAAAPQVALPPLAAPREAPREAPPPAPPPRSLPPPQPGGDLQQVARILAPLRQELRALHTEMRSLAGELVNAERVESVLEDLRAALPPAAPPRLPAADLLDQLRERLLEAGLRRELAAHVLEEVTPRLPADPAEAAACLSGIAAAVIAGELRAVAPLEGTGAGRRVALVGPAGVGKTTTLAKIAARATLFEGRRVGLIGCDTDRIGAVRALEDVARLLGVPHRVARGLAELRQALAELADCDLILIDTSGHSPRDPVAMDALAALLAGADVEPCLLLNADLRALELDGCVRGFAAVRPRSLIITKVDQALGHAGLYDAARSSGLPLMYLTTGRRIPDDLEAATPARVAALVMGLHQN